MDWQFVKLFEVKMIKRFITIVLLIFLFNLTNVCSQNILKSKSGMSNKIEEDREKVLDVTHRLTQLMIDKNTVEINKLLDSSFTLTHITGYVQPKQEWLLEIEKETMKYYSFTEITVFVNIHGDKAVFIGQNVLDARIWGTRNKWRLQQTMQLEKRNDKWIILQSVAALF